MFPQQLPWGGLINVKWEHIVTRSRCIGVACFVYKRKKEQSSLQLSHGNVQFRLSFSDQLTCSVHTKSK
jgi:hypothetical protein